MKTISKMMIGICVMWSASTMAAQPVEYWGCKFNEGKDMGDLMGWTEKWNEVADDLSDQSYSAWVMTTMFTESMSQYDFIWGGAWGSYQQMGTGMGEFFGGDEGSALFAEFQEITTCNSHTLWTSVTIRQGE